jgi:hypothetical protein
MRKNNFFPLIQNIIVSKKGYFRTVLSVKYQKFLSFVGPLFKCGKFYDFIQDHEQVSDPTEV